MIYEVKTYIWNITVNPLIYAELCKNKIFW